MHSPAASALLVLVVLVGASGCSDRTSDNAGQTVAPTTPDASVTRTPTANSTASSPAGVEPFSSSLAADDGGHGSGNGLGLIGVRTGRHAGFDRVVFDLGGAGIPGWRVEYMTRPRAEGSGDPVKLKGTVFLQVILRGLGLPYDTGIAPYGDSSTRVPGVGTHGVTEIAPGGVFEGSQQAFIALTGAKRPFRAFALTNPARVVVDVRHD